MKIKKIFVLSAVLLVFLTITSCSNKKCKHESSSWITTIDATCENNGLKKKICSKCTEVLEEQVINKLGHDIEHHEGKEATCEEDGYKPYDTCKNCSYTTYEKIKASGHKESNWIIDVNATCSKEGSKHKECSVCHGVLIEEKIQKSNHDIEHHEGKEATCEEDGYKPYDTCKNCSYTTYEEIKASGHKESNWIIDVNATCLKEGSKHKECSVCHEVLIEETIQKLNHDIEHHEGKEATCEEDGYKPYDTCKNCSYTTYEKIKASGHKESDWIIDVNATCLKEGSKHKECSVCHEVLIEEKTDYSGHNYVNQVCSYCHLAELSNLQFELINNKYYSLVGLNNTNNVEKVIIPESYNGLPVYKINDDAFSDCTTLKYIEIPDSIKYLNQKVFSGCSSLIYNEYKKGYYLGNDKNPYLIFIRPQNIKDEAITISRQTNFMLYTFTSNVKSVYYDGTIEDWCNITLTNADSNPMYNAQHFYMLDSNKEYKEVTEIEIPDTITEIGNYQFFGFNNVTKISIPSSVTSIGNCAFSNCTRLKNITIPSSVTSIGGSAFFSCSSLVSITNNSNLKLTIGSTDNGCIAYYAYKLVNKDGSITYKDNNKYTYIETLDDFLFRYDSNYKYQLVAYLGMNDTATLPEYINGSIYEIFQMQCSKNIIIPNTIIIVEEGAFSNCWGLENVYYNGTIQDWCNITLTNAYSNPMSYAQHFYMLDSNKEYKEVTEIEIPDTITTIDNYKFYGFNNVTKIIVSKSITNIGESAFRECSSLTSIEIPSSVTSIGGFAFSGCSSLTNVYYNGTIEDWCNITINDITSNPMWYAQHFYMLDSNKEYKEVTEIEIPDTITEVGNYQFYGFNNVTKITIPSSVTYIGGSAFSNCSGLTSIEIPSSVTSIGYRAFSDCSSLTSIVIPSSVTCIEGYAFNNCSNLVIYCEATSKPSDWDMWWNASFCQVYWCVTTSNYAKIDDVEYILDLNNFTTILIRYIGNANSFDVPSSFIHNNKTYNVTSIGNRAFYKCSSLTSIEIPSSVTSIGGFAFSGCSSLTNVYYNGTIEDWCNIKFSSDTSNPMYYAQHFYMLDSNKEYKEVTEIEIPDTITEVGKYQFYGFNNVTKITIPSSVKSIGSFAFFGCTSLTNIEISSSVTSIGYRAFSNCSSLTIYCEASSEPIGWASDWNDDNIPVVWDYKNNQ